MMYQKSSSERQVEELNSMRAGHYIRERVFGGDCSQHFSSQKHTEKAEKPSSDRWNDPVLQQEFEDALKEVQDTMYASTNDIKWITF